MASTAILNVKILTDASNAAKGMNTASSKVGRLQSGLSKMTGPALIAGAAVIAFGKSAFDAASKSQQAMGAVDSVFGDSAKTVKGFAATAAESTGLSAASYAEMASVMGAQLKNMGVDQDQLAGKTDGLISMGADLAAQFGGPTSDAVAALSSLMRGETDPIEQYGVSIKEVDIAAQMAADGTSKLKGEQGKAARTAALMTLLTNQTADAHGAFAREADSAAGAQQIATAKMEDAKAAIGEGLLPVMATLADKFATVAEWAGKHPKLFTAIGAAVLAFAAAILVLNVAMSIYTAVTTIAAVVTWAMLWPILAVVAGVALLAIGFILLWKKSQTFRKIVTAVWNAVKTQATNTARTIKTIFLGTWRAISAAARVLASAVRAVWQAIKSAASAVAKTVKTIWTNVWSALKTAAKTIAGVAKTAFQGIKTAVENVVSKIRDLIGKVKDIKVPGAVKTALDAIKSAADKVIGVIQDIISALKNIPTPSINWPSPPKWFDKVMPGMVAPAPAPGPTVAARGAAPSATAAGTAGGITINVTGAVDPEAVARQINRILSGHSRRVGLRT